MANKVSNPNSSISRLSGLRVALVHDWILGMRGGERVLEAVCEIFPQADIFTLLYDPRGISPTITSHKVFTSALQKIPFSKSKYRYFLPLMPTLVESFDFEGYDLVISLSHAVAKGVITKPDTLHISYIFTPMRYAWDMAPEYFGRGKANPLVRLAALCFLPYLRIWDRASSARVDKFVAISKFVAGRVKKCYGREAEVIYPPVEVQRFEVGNMDSTDSPQEEEFYLIVSALVRYKKVDLAVLAFNRLGLPLKVVGSGPELDKLKKIASDNIEFLGKVSDREAVDLYSRAKGFIFPQIEEFGIAAMEANAAGTPVIAFRGGAALETVIDPSTGSGQGATVVFFEEQTPESLIEVVRRAKKVSWDPELMRKNALKFSKERFKRELTSAILESL